MDLESRAREILDKRNAKEMEVYRQLREADVPAALAKLAKAWGKEKIKRELGVEIVKGVSND